MKTASINGSMSLGGATSAELHAGTNFSPAGVLAIVNASNPSASFSTTASFSGGGRAEMTMKERGRGATASGSGTLHNTDAAGDVRVMFDPGDGPAVELASALPGESVAFSFSLSSEDQKLKVETA